MIKLLFKLHRRLTGYPCREEVRLILATKKLSALKYRVAMLYVCGYNIDEISFSTGISVGTVKETLNIICL